MMNKRCQQYGKQRHDHQWLPRRHPRSSSIPLTETKCHNDSSTKIDSSKKSHNDHTEAVRQSHAGHRIFSQPADQKSAQDTHQQDTGILHEDRNSKRGYLAPEQHFVALAFSVPASAVNNLA